MSATPPPARRGTSLTPSASRALLGWKAEFSRRLREQRKTSGLSLERAGALVRMPSAVLGSYERGDRAVTVENLHRIADAYGVTAASLIPNVNPWLDAVEFVGGQRRTGSTK